MNKLEFIRRLMEAGVDPDKAFEIGEVNYPSADDAGPEKPSWPEDLRGDKPKGESPKDDK